MKISRHADGSKALEISVTETDDSVLSLQGDTAVTAKHRTSGEVSSVATITQAGSVDFVDRPSVGGVNVALATDGEGSLETQERTVLDNSTTVIALCPVQELVTVLYAIRNDGAREHGEITITKSSSGFSVSASQHAETGYFSDIEFSATENNGSLLLNVVGSGAGLITDFKYRVNSVNTLYL
ncbi:hypothetical protein NVP1123O_57 [Vibrio phage 1.123.O._10N.286.48.F3]|nr:hypothetical protein NVP1123O_57 [Vibrio phage 1.123.O._10N.286.48.F3]